MDNTNKNPDERIAELEAELDRVRRERDLYQSSHNKRMREALDSIPPVTREEALELLHTPSSTESIGDVIAEFQQRLRNR